MLNYISFHMHITGKVADVLALVDEMVVKNKMKFYCDENKVAIEQFDQWCGDIRIKKSKGFIEIQSDHYMYEENLHILEMLLYDIEEKIPKAKFSGNMTWDNSDTMSTSIDFEMKDGMLTTTTEYFREAFDDEEDYDEYD